MTDQKSKLDTLFSDFTLNEFSQEPIEKLPITQWVPAEYKKKYDFLQGKYNRRFAGEIQKIMMKAIDMAIEKAG